MNIKLHPLFNGLGRFLRSVFLKNCGRRFLLSMLVFLSVWALSNSALAAGTATSGLKLSSITTNLDGTVQSAAKILEDISLIAGICFVFGAFFKFHQHKLNPTQVPVSQGVTLLLIGAGLLLFPIMVPTAKNAVIGSAKIGQVGGSQITSIIGSGGTTN